MRRTALLLLLASTAVAAAATPARAQWSPGGVPLCDGTCSPDGHLIVSDAAGGAFIAWRDIGEYPVTDADVYMQHVTGAGTIAPGWPSRGLPVAVVPEYQAPTRMAPDGQGGAFVTWEDLRNVAVTNVDVYAQHALADGSIAPGWPVSGAPATVESHRQDIPAIAQDGAGGAYVVWEDERNYAVQATDVYAQHLMADGSVAPGWPADGLPVAAAPAGQGGRIILVPDDSGGVVAVFGDVRSGETSVYAQHLLADGSIAPGWVANGVPLIVGRGIRGAVRDDAGGFYLGSATVTCPPCFDFEYYVQRFTFAGTPAPGWPLGGVKVCGASYVRDGLTMDGDGFGGVFMTWHDYRPPPTGGEIYAARVQADGSLAAGWTADGTLVSDPTNGQAEFAPEIARDGAGGAYIAWGREATLHTGYVHHLTGSGQAAPGWPRYGIPLALPPSLSQFDPSIASDGQGGAIVTWDEQGAGRRGEWAQRFQMDGPVPAALALVSASVSGGRVLLEWYAADAASLSATVYRRTASTEWGALGPARADGTGHLRYEDRDVTPGGRYAYRLGYLEQGAERYSAETWVEVPRAVLALEGARPNPAVGRMSVAFSLPDGSPASLTMLDVAGREVARHEVGSLGAGRHVVPMGSGAPLAPGLYWIRLTQGGRALLARAIVIR